MYDNAGGIDLISMACVLLNAKEPESYTHSGSPVAVSGRR